MILLVGLATDRVLKYFAHYAIRNGHTIVLFDQRKIGSACHISSKGISINEKQYSFSDFTGVLSRIAEPNPFFEKDEKHLCLINTLSHILDSEIPNVLNPSLFCASNDSKLLQLLQIKRKYLHIPDSAVIAKQPAKFVLHNHSRLIFKSLSSIRSRVIEYKPTKVLIDQVSHEPVLFQKLIEGSNIRVHVVGNKVIPVKIKASEIDYRYDCDENRKFEESVLPNHIIKECLDISEQTRLTFCGIDLIQSGDQYYLLEVNPAPGYSYFETQIESKNISKALLEVLSG
jgi:glutathione synthase/RimK-type ligase-like ATP-grasp enzyme